MVASSLAKKLGIKAGYKLLVLNAPEGYMATLGELPEGTEVKSSGGGTFDFVQVFVYNKKEIDKHATEAARSVKAGGLLWFCYPKKTSKIKTDVTRDQGWDSVFRAGLVGVAQVAVDETWTATRFRRSSEVGVGWE